MPSTFSAVLVGIDQPLELINLELPELKPGQVLVDVAYSGVCRSQINEIRGKRGDDPYIPHTLGHEGSGVVVAIGENVTKVSPGDRVVLTWIKADGLDVPGTVYQADIGTVNSGAISTFMQQAVVSENRLVRISDDMPLREAALLGCAIPTGAGIVFHTARLGPKESIAVFGAGGIGLSAIMAAKTLGASQVVAVDVIDEKLDLARSMGATDTINAAKEDVVERLSEITNGKGTDFAIEAAGRTETMEQAFHAVSDGGGLCILAGNAAFGEKINLDPFDFIRGKRLVGSWGGESKPDQDIPKFERMFLEGKLPLGLLITHEYSLLQLNQALEDVEQGKAGRAIIKLKE